MARSSLRWSWLVALMTVSAAVHADPLPSLNLRGFAPPPGPKGTIYMESVNTPGHLLFNVNGWASWAWRPLVVRQGGEVVDKLVSHQTSLDLGGAVGLGKRFEIGATLPFVLYQTGDSTARTARVLGGSTIPSQAVGDLTLGLKYALKPVDEELGGFGAALVGRVGIPTGMRDSTLGEGQLTTEARLLGEVRLISLSAQGTLGFKVRPSERDFGGETWGNEIPWGIALGVKPQMFGLDKKGSWKLGVEAHGALPAGPEAPFTSAPQSPAFVGATARYAIGDLQLLGAVETGVSQGAGAAPLRVVLGASFAPRDHDLDNDGIPDDKDECKKYPEDKDGFEDKDGCPEPDNDNDNVLDADDKCPLEPEDEDDFDDDDGCPDPDNDKDGILDGKDACPDEAGPASNDPKKNGCPIRDADGDGVMGEKDQCPDQPEDKDGFEDDDGCPDLDNDKDGIPDAEDRCPDKAGERSAMPDQNGCPSPDLDRDGIPNEADRCPDQPETYNGFEDDDGCPDTPRGKPRPLVEVVERRGTRVVELSAPLKFQKGTTELDAKSKATARALAQQLAQQPGLAMVVAVRPAQADGGDELAQKRSQALVTLLIQGSRRPDAATSTGWVRGKMAPNAEVAGVSLQVASKP